MQCSELVFNAIQARIPARIPPIPEAITGGDFDWEGGRRQKSRGKVESGNLTGKVRRKVKMEIVETFPRGFGK